MPCRTVLMRVRVVVCVCGARCGWCRAVSCSAGAVSPCRCAGAGAGAYGSLVLICPPSDESCQVCVSVACSPNCHLPVAVRAVANPRRPPLGLRPPPPPPSACMPTALACLHAPGPLPVHMLTARRHAPKPTLACTTTPTLACTHPRPCLHACTHARAHMHAPTPSLARAYFCSITCAHTRAHTSYAHTLARSFACIHALSLTHMHAHAWSQACGHTCTPHARTHARMFTRALARPHTTRASPCACRSSCMPPRLSAKQAKKKQAASRSPARASVSPEPATRPATPTSAAQPVRSSAVGDRPPARR